MEWFDRAGLEVTRRGEVFSILIPVRWGDLDANGKVNAPVYFDYLQDARVDFLLHEQVTQMLEEGVVATGHTIQYRQAIRWSPDPVRVHIVMLERRLAKFRVGYLLTQGESVCAVAASTMVPFDVASQRPRKLSSAEVEVFDRYLWELVSPMRPLPRPGLHGRGHVLPVQTRWSDIDKQDHVNNVRMLDYFQESRLVLTAQLEADHPGLPWVIAQQEVEYLHQMRFRREPYQVATAVTAIGASSMSVASELIDPASTTLIARSRMALVRVNQLGQPERIPDKVRDGLAPWQVTS